MSNSIIFFNEKIELLSKCKFFIKKKKNRELSFENQVCPNPNCKEEH